MRKIREILRLKYSCGCSLREISNSYDMGRGTVSDYLQHTNRQG